jgi:ribonuclease T2
MRTPFARNLVVIALGTVLLLSSALARSRRPTNQHVPPGQFDYYLLSLSWAPDFCDRPNVKKDPRECGPGRRLGFVVHGLWPQLDNGGHPSQCATASPVANDIVQRMLAFIPGESLIQHEWRDHGTCSGLAAGDYFDTIRRAFGSIVIPPDYKQPGQRIDVAPQDIEAKFVAANPNFKDSIRVACSNGELEEVRVCMSKDLSPRPCGTHDTSCPAPHIAMQPVK